MSWISTSSIAIPFEDNASSTGDVEDSIRVDSEDVAIDSEDITIDAE